MSDVQFHPNESVRDGVGRIAEELIRQALHHIHGSSPDRGQDLHEVRLALKWLRALVRLMRPSSPKEFYQSQNRWLRETGRRLASLRDAAVAQQTMEQICQKTRKHKHREFFQAVRKGFARQEKKQPQSCADLEPALQESRPALRRIKRDFSSLRLNAAGWPALEPGLRAAYHQCRRRMRQAMRREETGDYHEWRKVVKALYYHLQMLEGAWPQRFQRMIRQLKKLQIQLGHDHDLALLSELLRQDPLDYGGQAAVKRFDSRLERESRKTRRYCVRLGRRIFEEKTGEFVGQAKKHWKRWKELNS